MFKRIKSGSLGFQEEKDFFNIIEKTFINQSAFAFQQIPFNISNRNIRYEPDVLLFHKELGLFIFEVKSLKINQLIDIHGTEWHCVGGDGQYVISPQKQAENQMFHIKNILDARCMLHNRYNSNAFVVLPNISSSEWYSREELQREYIQTPIFKDDILNPVVFERKLHSLIHNQISRPLPAYKWNQVLHYFKVSNVITEENFEKSLFSELHLLSYVPENYSEELAEKLNKGLKIFILSKDASIINLKDKFLNYIDEFQLLIYMNNKANNIVENVFISDGKIDFSRLDALEEEFPDFNVGQFKIVHSDPNSNLSVSAGAGTGKTHVMVDRILYLILAHQVNLDEIEMITFTNAATDEMRSRLEKKLLKLFELTRQASYLNYAEDVANMNISTIHSYAKHILTALSHEMGYSPDLSLRSFRFEKQKIILELLDEYFHNVPVTDLLSTNIKYYDLSALILGIWDEIEKKGLSYDDIQSLDFGTASGKSRIVQDVLVKVLKECESRLDHLKKEQQAISLGDLIRRLKTFTRNTKSLSQLDSGKYLFVDEFQDSDDVQIEFLAKLQEILEYKLFVVGDIKQAIYRFRGADYKAFNELSTRIKSPLTSLTLRHNYRTSSTLLEKMNTRFLTWGTSNNLIYSLEDKLVSNKTSHSKEWTVKKYSYSNKDQVNVELIKEHLEELPKKGKMAILVRTNFQAKLIKTLCEQNNIPTVENLDGQFFVGEPVKHFYSLLQALQYPDHHMFIIEALKTPYFGYRINEKNFIATQGNRHRIKDFLNSVLDEPISSYAKLLRDHSPMTIIQKIIREQSLYTNIKEYYKSEKLSDIEVEVLVERYKVNHRHLLSMIEQQFSSKSLTISLLSNWLSVQMKTNRVENEPLVTNDEAKIVITTVHRAKGLQYHTIFLAETERQFNSIEPNFYVGDSSNTIENRNKKLSWKFGELQNSNHRILEAIENQETRKEETRLLYVALTRAEQKIIISLPYVPKEDTWASLLI